MGYQTAQQKPSSTGLSIAILSALGDISPPPTTTTPQANPKGTVYFQFPCSLWACAPLASTCNVYLSHLPGYFSQTPRLTFYLSDLHEGIWTPSLHSQGYFGSPISLDHGVLGTQPVPIDNESWLAGPMPGVSRHSANPSHSVTALRPVARAHLDSPP